MAWILLLIQIIPSIVKLIQLIREAINKNSDREDRRELRRQMNVLARDHVHRLVHHDNEDGNGLVEAGIAQQKQIEKEWQDFYEKVKVA